MVWYVVCQLEERPRPAHLRWQLSPFRQRQVKFMRGGRRAWALARAWAVEGKWVECDRISNRSALEWLMVLKKPCTDIYGPSAHDVLGQITLLQRTS